MARMHSTGMLDIDVRHLVGTQDRQGRRETAQAGSLHPTREGAHLRKLVLSAVVALSTAGALAAPAAAAPAASVCGSIQVTVNGSDVVNQATCQVLPPE